MSITILVLGLAIAIAAFSFIPVAGVQPRKDEKPKTEDALVMCEDIAKYTHGELILRLDRYLGGGITATQYYEDIVGQILNFARTAARKRQLVRAAAQAAFLGQLLFAFALLRG